MSVSIIAQAKADLEAAGQKWETDCDAYRITNLAAQRTPGWLVIEKTSGVNCQGRKVDGIITGGKWYDVLVGGGPPNNSNIPAWQEQGPVGSLVGVQPYEWPDPVNRPNPPTPDPPLPDMALFQEILDKLNVLIAAVDDLYKRQGTDTASIIARDDYNTEKIQAQIHQVSEDMQETAKKAMVILAAMRNPE